MSHVTSSPPKRADVPNELWQNSHSLFPSSTLSGGGGVQHLPSHTDIQHPSLPPPHPPISPGASLIRSAIMECEVWKHFTWKACSWEAHHLQPVRTGDACLPLHLMSKTGGRDLLVSIGFLMFSIYFFIFLYLGIHKCQGVNSERCVIIAWYDGPLTSRGEIVFCSVPPHFPFHILINITLLNLGRFIVKLHSYSS